MPESALALTLQALEQVPSTSVFESVPLVNWTPPGLLALVVFLILFGRIVPRRTLEDIKADRDDWKKAHEISETARIEQSRQLDQLLEFAKTSDAVIRALATSAAITDIRAHTNSTEILLQDLPNQKTPPQTPADTAGDAG